MFNAGLMLLNLLWFLWVVRSFEYKAVEHPSMRQAPAQKPQGTLPPWVQPQVVSGVQQGNVSVRLRNPLNDIALSRQMLMHAGYEPVLYVDSCTCVECGRLQCVSQLSCFLLLPCVVQLFHAVACTVVHVQNLSDV